MSCNLRNRSFLKLLDFTPEEIKYLLDLSAELKKAKQTGSKQQRLKGKNIALIFEKASTRTRCAFEVAAIDQGAHVTYIGPSGSQIGEKESMKDTARVLGRMYDGIEYRGFGQNIVEDLAKYAGVPVYNGLTDLYHPTQTLADIMTLEESFGSIKGRTLCYVGDGRNNVANSLMIISAKLGVNFTVITPKELNPDQSLLQKIAPAAEKSGAVITVTSDISAVKGAEAIYTDVWISMGEEDKREERIRLLSSYQVNQKMMDMTGNSGTIFLHCLPAVKGEEVTVEVIDGPQSKAWDQAENRKHTIKAVMLATMTK